MLVRGVCKLLGLLLPCSGSGLFSERCAYFPGMWSPTTTVRCQANTPYAAWGACGHLQLQFWISVIGMRLQYFFVVFFFGSFTLFLVRYVNLKALVQPISSKAANMISASIKPPRTNHLMHEPKSLGLLLSGLRTHAPSVKPHSTGRTDVEQFKTWRGPPNKAVEKELTLKKMSTMKMDSYHTELDDVYNSTDTDASKNIFESAGHSCKDSLCLNFLTAREKEAFHLCLATVTKWSRDNHLDMRKINQASGACHFRYGKGLGHVGLVSPPGSGNTWVRDLLQRATGICTGSYFCDGSLRTGGFDGEGTQSSSVVAIKSHSSTPFWTAELGKMERGFESRIRYDSVILLVRNPFDSLVAEWNRKLSSKYHIRRQFGMQHTESHNQTFFMNHLDWKKYIKTRITKWVRYFDWMVDIPEGHTLLFVRYEDLKANVTKEVKRMLEFLHYRDTDEQLKQRLLTGVDAFKRMKTKKFEHYILKDKLMVNRAINSVKEFLQLQLGDTFGVEEYVTIT